MGLLCEYGGAALQPQYMNILQRLYPLFSNQPAPEVCLQCFFKKEASFKTKFFS
jgi:hypothetical protein